MKVLRLELRRVRPYHPPELFVMFLRHTLLLLENHALFQLVILLWLRGREKMEFIVSPYLVLFGCATKHLAVPLAKYVELFQAVLAGAF